VAGSLPVADQVAALVERGGNDAALILQRVLPPAKDLAELKQRYRQVIFDIDDAIYTVPPDLAAPWLRKLPKRAARFAVRGSVEASVRRQPLERVLRTVDACVVGNSVLGEFARRFARRVVEIPTTVDPVTMPPTSRPAPPVVVWMGLPDNLQYLKLVRWPLEQLAQQLEFRLRVVSSRSWDGAPLAVEHVPWSPEAARDALLSSSVGIAPLTDDSWTRGKCAFRSIQYGGHALPAIASPVGITDRVVLHGKTGFLARTDQDWLSALGQLLSDSALVDEMGRNALAHVREEYSDAVSVRLWRRLLEELS
jgi:hypothetical protein